VADSEVVINQNNIADDFNKYLSVVDCISLDVGGHAIQM
jgi:hypothetical protein